MTETNNCDTTINKEITKTQAKFLDFCEEFAWGKLEVTVKNGQPVMVTPVKQDFKMD